jgi:membrane protease subunit HflC
MNPTKSLIGLLVLVLVLLGFSSLYTIGEGESALVQRLGKIVSNSKGEPFVAQPGLHCRIPFIDNVRIFDTRIQELATSPSQPLTVVTKEQTYLVVEYFAKWRISNLPRFYTSTGGSVRWAETLLEQKINDIVRGVYGKYTSAQAISFNRDAMVAEIKEQANHVGKDQGIYVIDVRIQQITLPTAVMSSVFKRMETERKQFAEAKRAEGVEKSEEVKALADQKVTVIKAQALMQGANLRAQGDREASIIYSKAYGLNPGFYSFYRSIEAYEKSFNNKNDVLVLKPEGQFFNYFHNAQGSSAVKR